MRKSYYQVTRYQRDVYDQNLIVGDFSNPIGCHKSKEHTDQYAAEQQLEKDADEGEHVRYSELEELECQLKQNDA